MVDDGSRILAGRYEVGELIGRGGMAEVHIGHDTRLGRTVAIKVLRSDLARDPSFQARFRREAQAAAALNHPAIVAVYDTGEDLVTEPTGAVAHVPFIVMEYVEGHTVRDILRDGHAVPIDEAVEITAGVLSALEYSHHAGIVHRDIKPANVMLTPTGAVKVMDFGIARAVADSAATMTQTQAVIGTAQYLSPEQARGESVDARSDLYSTGCLLFELLTGRPPFIGDSPVAVAYQHVREAAPAPSSFASDVPDTLDRITLKALAKDREQRYSTAAEFRADLEAAVRGGNVLAPAVAVAAAAAAATLADPATQVLAPATAATQVVPPGVPPWAPTTPGTGATPTAFDEEEEPRRKWLMWTLIAVAVLAVGGILWLILTNNQDPGTDQVQVPNVVGKTAEEAQAELEAADLEMRPVEEASDDVPEGSVTKTDPVADTEVDKGSTVDVYISTGPGSVTIDDVSGLTQDQARAQLEEQGLTVSRTEQDNSPDFPADRVTKTEPAAGTAVDAGSEVVLFVSTGQVELPDLRGQTREAALATLNSLKLQGNTTPVESTETEGTVVDQDRSPGLVPQGTVVNLSIATPPTTATIPTDIVGKSYDDAAAQLSTLGLTAARNDVDSEEPEGQVITSNPAPGTTVAKGSTVTLNVSRGPGDGGEGGGDGG